MISARDISLGERRLFAALARDPKFKGKLYRDGVPRPDVYLKQHVRVVLVFREPNLAGRPYAVDMGAEVRDPCFRQSRDGKLGEPGRRLAWWNNKVGSYGHAVLSSFKGLPAQRAFADWKVLLANEYWRAHDCLLPFGFMQIKKVGGSGRSSHEEIEYYAREYA